MDIFEDWTFLERGMLAACQEHVPIAANPSHRHFAQNQQMPNNGEKNGHFAKCQGNADISETHKYFLVHLSFLCAQHYNSKLLNVC